MQICSTLYRVYECAHRFPRPTHENEAKCEFVLNTTMAARFNVFIQFNDWESAVAQSCADCSGIH